MRLVSVSIKNFRCYQNSITVPFDNLTTFVGKNDIGKSTLLEALEIFFNNDTVKIEQTDANVNSEDKQVSIACEFDELPEKLILDSDAETTLAEEFLLTGDNTLKIEKVFDCSKKAPSVEVFIIAHHPTAEGFSNLLELKESQLQQKVKDAGLSVPLKGNPGMRRALWDSVKDLKFASVSIPVSKPKEDSKRIYEQLENYLPIYALFQSDRSSRDSDDEVQSPMKAAISAAIGEMKPEIERIQTRVREKAEEIAKRTHEALKTIDPGLAKELNPQFTPPPPSKWTSLFSINMDTEDGIPLNKRGSGVRRLILVSFFKAEAERRLITQSTRSIIYAIEEPETAQHPGNQRILLESFKALSHEDKCQVILTTHSPGFASELPTQSIRFVTRDQHGKPDIKAGVDVFGLVAETLGVVPDSRIKVLFCVEGPTDVEAFKYLSKALHVEDPSIPDLSRDGRVAFIVLGGSTLKHWVTHHYLKAFRRPEIHIYDRDVPTYGKQVEEINKRSDGSWALLTKKYEIENYLHPNAIKDAFKIEMTITDEPVDGKKGVPEVFGELFSVANRLDGIMKPDKSKIKLANRAFPKMTSSRIRERDPEGEVEGWFRKIAATLDRTI